VARFVDEAWPWAQGQATAAGGVLFLVAMLERLGYPAWLQCLPEGVAQHCVAALWTRLFTRLALPATDPAWALALDAQGGPHALPPPADQQALVAIEARLRPARARRVAPWYGTTHQPTAAQALGERWLALARHGLRSRAGLGLHDLVMRPGWLLLTRTHADMVFDLHAVDLRVRRAGLDLNPGWVPWLGRVVGFHFERLPWLADAIGTNDA
jgi:hypothetical protein